VLRFEVTLRKKQLDRIGTRELYTSEFVQAYLQKYLHQVLHGAVEATTLDEVADRLVRKYGKTKGLHLYSFYRVYYGEPNGRKKLLRYLTRQKVWYNLKQLSNANVGLHIDHIPDDFNITIPSSYATNQLPPPTGGGSVG